MILPLMNREPIIGHMIRPWSGIGPELGLQTPFELFACSRALLLAAFTSAAPVLFSHSAVLQPGAFAHHIARFNSMEAEQVSNFVPNKEAWTWLQENIPLFECPDRELEEIYYYRWWSFRKHLAKTPKGFVFTEFLTPVNHAGEFNTISCAAGFHVTEGRWLHNQSYVDDYIDFWLRGNSGKPQPHFHKYSSWFATAVFERYCVNGDTTSVVGLLDDLVSDYRTWERERLLT